MPNLIPPRNVAELKEHTALVLLSCDCCGEYIEIGDSIFVDPTEPKAFSSASTYCEYCVERSVQ